MWKQVKITKLFKKKGRRAADVSDDCEDLKEELQRLERDLKDTQVRLFQVQRHCFKHKLEPPKKKDEEFTHPQKIMVTSSIKRLERSLDLYTMLTGMEVKSYVKDEHCCILYHIQHAVPHETQHGLRINLRNGDNGVSSYSLPLGFNFNAVMEDYDSVMTPECLRAVRKALVAYYDRLEQFQNLKALVSPEVQLFKIMDGSHIEVELSVRSVYDSNEDIKVMLMLDYRVYDIRPKHFSLGESDLSPDAVKAIKAQCSIFKREPLADAFKKCFLQGKGPFLFVDEIEEVKEDYYKHTKARPARARAYSDDEYQPHDHV